MYSMVNIPDLNTSIEFFGGGRQWEQQHRTPFDLISTFPDKVLKLGSRDVVLVNSGVHDNTPRETLEKSVPVAQVVAQTVGACQQTSETCPIIFWRESTPQHFATASGNWRPHPWKSLQVAWDNVDQSMCRPVEDLNRSRWSNFRNEMTNPILENAGVPILRVYKPLAGLYQEHCLPNDCTHGSVAHYDFLTQYFSIALTEYEQLHQAP